MGFIDSIYILDDNNKLLFEQIFSAASPSFAYIRNQLESYKKDVSNEEVESPFSNSYSNSVFLKSTGETIDPIVKLDSNYIAAWSKISGFYFVIVGTTPESTVDVISDDEDEDDDDDDEDDDDENQALEENSDKEIHITNRHSEYAQFDDEEQREQDQEQEQVQDGIPQLGSTKKKDIAEPDVTAYKLSNTVNPILYMEFLKVFHEITEAFLKAPLTPHKIEANAHNIMLLLQEMVDPNTPYITDLNQLRELLPNNSILNQLISTTKKIQKTATTSLNNITNNPVGALPAGAAQFNYLIKNSGSSSSPHSSKYQSQPSIFQKSGNDITWRRVNVHNSQNEIFIDVTERLTLVIPPKKIKQSSKADSYLNSNSYYSSYGQSTSRNQLGKKLFPISAYISGEMKVKCSLPGTPQLYISTNLNGHDIGIPSFHRSVEIEKWVNNPGYISLIPPDESFTLMQYNINLLDNGAKSETASNVMNYTGFVDVELLTGIDMKRNEFEIRANIRMTTTVQKIDDLRIEIILPDTPDYKGTAIKSLRMTHGDLQQIENGNYVWVFDKNVAMGLNCTFRGVLSSEDEQDFDQDSHQSSKIKRPAMLKVSYSNKEAIPSGLKISSITIDQLDPTSNSNIKGAPKPYKGVKYITKIDDFIVR